jgi:Tfp pilus assembly protein PilP
MKRLGLSLAIVLLALGAPGLLTASEKAGPEITQGRPTSALLEISKKPLYVYSVRGRRDPFVFQGEVDPRAIKAQSGEFSVAELRLVGFIESGNEKMALFKQGNQGNTFTLRSGRLYSPESVQIVNVKGNIQANGEVHLTQGERKVVFNSFKTHK